MDHVVERSAERLVKVSGIGQDRPGIVYKIASVIRRSGGNIRQQRSMQVAGEFAIVVVASFSNGSQNPAQTIMQELTGGALGDNFVVFARELKNTVFATPSSDGTNYIVEVSGDDRMGIVEEMTLFLLQHNLNVDSMESDITHVPFEGTTKFTSRFEITVPQGFDIDTFRFEIEQIERNSELVIRTQRVERAVE